jgi:hypothetical protein
MPPTQRRRPGRGAASHAHMTKNNNSATNITETGLPPQLLGLRAFWTEAGGLVTCTIIRRSDRRLWPVVLAARVEVATTFEYALREWIAYAADSRPLCLGCDATFSRLSLPTNWAMLMPLQEKSTMPAAMLSAICSRCSRNRSKAHERGIRKRSGPTLASRGRSRHGGPEAKASQQQPPPDLQRNCRSNFRQS